MEKLDDVLLEWYRSTAAKYKLSITDQKEINEAGAKVLAKRLEEVTRDKHYSKRKHKVHLADTVGYVPNNVDGEDDGSYTVGFLKKSGYDNGYIAKFLNDGTIYIPADHFVDNVRTEMAPAVQEAQARAYKKLLEKRGEA